MSNVSILIIEDEMIIAMDIESKLKKLGYDVAGIISNSDKAVDFLSFNTPDLVLCDVMIKGGQDGIEVAEKVMHKKIPFVFLTSLSDRSTLERAQKVLPFGYIVKPFNERDLFSSIEMALYKHHAELEKLKITPQKINKIALEDLTSKEYEVLMGITKGLNNSQIAEQHFVSINTVKHHIRNILSKLGATNRAQALHKIIELLTSK